MPSIIHEVSGPYKKATFGMGCFWANDCLFGAQPGVLRTRVGYSGGTTMDPVYRSIDKEAGTSSDNNTKPTNRDRGDHTEVVDIDYDPKVISYEDLLQMFWNNHEYGLTTIIKKQYMSLILYHDEDQKRIAEISFKKQENKTKEKLITVIAPAGPMYPAEDYHQKYRLQGHPSLCKDIGLTPELLQSSHIAAKLNGYVAGLGTIEDLEKIAAKYNLTEKITSYVRQQMKENEGGSLFC
ncbi:unnamed protein product [Brassicogethes aeneus]|uniref:peptide-methionine (S)-S-oxide reductase n=1 Tax=Brassicogethes aeneus TaxID=1431903 RepID=A0A9P0ASF1_BRAAE|nr:unnamed protein product [Brassicogethes aeneus]